MPCCPRLSCAEGGRCGARPPPAHESLLPPDRACPCPAPLPPPQSALGPELLVALEARGTTFLPPSATAVEEYVRKTIAAEQTEDNFYV